MNFKRLETRSKLFGVYETPQNIARALAQHALAGGGATCLELGTGSGAFIDALAGSARTGSLTYTGYEVDPTSAAIARAKLCSGAFTPGSAVHTADVFMHLERISASNADIVVGNPPYIRYQYLEPNQQDAAETFFASLGIPFTRHTNAWTTFLLCAVKALRPGGTLAMVIPSELLHVLHARGVRNYLRSSLSEIHVVDIDEMLFDALQGAVLLLGTKKQRASSALGRLDITRYRDAGELPQQLRPTGRRVHDFDDASLDYKWMHALLHATELQALNALHASRTIRAFSEVAEVDVGIVTGANSFFLVDANTVAAYDLDEYVFPAFGRSDHVEGVIFGKADHKKNAALGLPAYMLAIPSDADPRSFPKKMRLYLREGESKAIHQRFKCRVRTPWWSVPSVYSSEIGLLKRAHDVPRLILNKANALTTDTAYRIRIKEGTGAALVSSFVNSVTALSAELTGRHYGGGVLELVPSEIERLLVPERPVRSDVLRNLDRSFRQDVPIEALLRKQDELLFTQAELQHVQVLHAAWRRLRNRRQRTVEAAS